ncbi:MAG: glycosyltransferase [Candidatus Heimdallarchaeaceae archaeon]
MNIKKLLKVEAEELSKNDNVKNKQVQDLIISLKMKDGHIHNVTPDNEAVRAELIEDLLSYTDLSPTLKMSEGETAEVPNEVVFHNRQAFGDVLTFTAGVRDFKKAFPNTRVGVISTAMHIWDHNPNIDHNFRDEKKMTKIGPGFLTNKSNSSDLHMANAFRIDIENKLGLKIPQGPISPDIWMTEEEYKAPPLIEGPYWVFVYGGEPGWPAKQYHRWQEVINLLKDDIQIVQLGVKGHPYPHLDNVIDYVGKTEDKHTGIRDLFNIFLHAQGSLGLVSMHMHLSAAFGNPCVVLAAAREPASFTQYFGHQYIHTNGTMFCGEHTACWKCKMEGCRNKVKFEEKEMPKCVEIIEPEEIAVAVRKYYRGGRLEYGKKIPNKFFKNISKESKIFVAPKVKQIDNDHLKNWGFQWGGSNITDRDWIFMKDILKEYEIKNVLDFGVGLSTLLIGTMTDTVVTFETEQKAIQNMVGLADPKKHLIKHWDGETVPDYKSPYEYDFAFVDGPSGGRNREWSTKYASEHADLIIVHDAGRVAEKGWQTKYLEADFQLIAKGGHRCHLWQRKSCIVSIEVDESKPLMRMITTTRGWGGSERSTCEIMGMFLEKGYRVELASTSNNVSGEYLSNIPKGVLQVPWDTIKAPADVSVLYASDTIWGYSDQKWLNVMPHMTSKRKVMVLNYKLGGAGQVAWTLDWDKYLFLNSTHESDLLKRTPDAVTLPLPPPTNLSKFLAVEPDYNAPLRLIRHNSQGDNKHPDYTNKMIEEMLKINPSAEFHFMPARSDCLEHKQVHKYAKNKPPVYDFLKHGNCFLYHLPPGYTEGGPKVVMEAMAAGLPCIVDNHSGMKDRVTDETGWKCDSYEDVLNVIKEITENPGILEIKGKAARQRALKDFDRQRWVEEIIGDEHGQ